MNRIQAQFEMKPRGLLSVYFTAGFPELESTTTIIQELEKCGVDLIEIGMPFSDPLADGPVIQHSSEVALANGMNMNILFDQLKNVRDLGVKIPLLLMGYLNPVLQYGMDKFCKQAALCGLDGLIIPDLPFSEYQKEYKPFFEMNGLTNILLVTPQTSEQRIRLIDEGSNGFIYAVSSGSTTGAKKSFDDEQLKYFKRLREMKLKNKIMIGFGISTRQAVQQACDFADGAIVGSAFITQIEKNGYSYSSISTFINELIPETK